MARDASMARAAESAAEAAMVEASAGRAELRALREQHGTLMRKLNEQQFTDADSWRASTAQFVDRLGRVESVSRVSSSQIAEMSGASAAAELVVVERDKAARTMAGQLRAATEGLATLEQSHLCSVAEVSRHRADDARSSEGRFESIRVSVGEHALLAEGCYERVEALAADVDTLGREVRHLADRGESTGAVALLKAHGQALTDVEKTNGTIVERLGVVEDQVDHVMALQLPLRYPHGTPARLQLPDKGANYSAHNVVVNNSAHAHNVVVNRVQKLEGELKQVKSDVAGLASLREISEVMRGESAHERKRLDAVAAATTQVTHRAESMHSMLRAQERQLQRIATMISDESSMDSDDLLRVTELEKAMLSQSIQANGVEERMRRLEVTRVATGAVGTLPSPRAARLRALAASLVAGARRASASCMQFVLVLICVGVAVHGPAVVVALRGTPNVGGQVTSSIGTAYDKNGAVAMMRASVRGTRVTPDLQTVARMNLTKGTVPSLMLSDSGASHYIDRDDFGCVDGSWQPDIPGLHLGDDSLIPAYGSCEKDYIDPGGGPDVRRRTLICPDVAARVWSQGREVDLHKSKYVDAPEGAYYELIDGRHIDVSKSKNALRWVGWKIRPTEHSTAMQLVAGSGRCMSMSTVTDQSGMTTVVMMNAGERLNAHTTGVGKR